MSTAEKIEEHELDKIWTRHRALFKRILRFLFSHAGLCFLNIAHLSIGALIFAALEGEQDAQADETHVSQLEASRRIDAARQDLIGRLQLSARFDNLSESVISEWVADYHRLIGNETSENGYKKSITEADLEPSTRWSFTSVLLFTLSIASSIGYGHIYPKTELGRLAVILYSLFAIPFFVMSLGSIGSGLAVALKVCYERAFCWTIIKRRSAQNENHEPPAEAVPATFGLAMVFIYIVLGGILFSYKEEWTYVQSIYFCVVTFMTIGFGDLVPGWSAGSSASGQLSIVLAFLYIVIGLSLVSMSLNVAVEALRHRITIVISKAKVWEDDDAENHCSDSGED